jgi:hypothetical protein
LRLHHRFINVSAVERVACTTTTGAAAIACNAFDFGGTLQETKRLGFHATLFSAIVFSIRPIT